MGGRGRSEMTDGGRWRTTKVIQEGCEEPPPAP